MKKTNEKQKVKKIKILPFHPHKKTKCTLHTPPFSTHLLPLTNNTHRLKLTVSLANLAIQTTGLSWCALRDFGLITGKYRQSRVGAGVAGGCLVLQSYPPIHRLDSIKKKNNKTQLQGEGGVLFTSFISDGPHLYKSDF